jgi:hypothetical protein
MRCGSSHCAALSIPLRRRRCRNANGPRAETDAPLAVSEEYSPAIYRKLLREISNMSEIAVIGDKARHR